MKTIIYDIEIKKAILGRNESPIEGIEYCEGWNDHENMGISCICAYNYHQDRYRTFCDDNFEDFQKLVNSSDHIISFNGLSFDNRVCEANNIIVPNEKSYDLLVEVWKATGLGPTFQYPSHAGYGLDACIKANFPDIGKTGHGALAPVQWQQGKIGSVIDYCLADVWLTRKLFENILFDGFILNPKNGERLIFDLPEWAI